MPIDVWAIRKRLTKKRSFKQYMGLISKEERDYYNDLLDAYMEKHFKNQSIASMKARLLAMGFKSGEVPKIGAIKKKLLLSQYWITSPKIDPDKDTWLHGESRIGSLLSTRMMYSHRRSLIWGLLKVERPDGKISGEANPCGTPTARFTHKKIVNIPSTKSFFGAQCRSLFMSDYNEGSKPFIQYTPLGDNQRVKPNTNIIQARKKPDLPFKDTGHPYRIFIPHNRDVFVGADASGLELRILTHYLIKVCSDLLREAVEAGNRELTQRYQEALESAYKYRETLLEGDIHSHNQALAGLPTRDAAKSMI